MGVGVGAVHERNDSAVRKNKNGREGGREEQEPRIEEMGNGIAGDGDDRVRDKPRFAISSQ